MRLASYHAALLRHKPGLIDQPLLFAMSCLTIASRAGNSDGGLNKKGTKKMRMWLCCVTELNRCLPEEGEYSDIPSQQGTQHINPANGKSEKHSPVKEEHAH